MASGGNYLLRPLLYDPEVMSPSRLEPTVPTGGYDDPQSHGNSWFSSMMIIIANVMGIGVLGLAHAFAKLGWLWGVIILAIAMLGSVYSGILLARMKQHCPEATIYSDLGLAAYGNLGRAFVTIFAYTFIVGICLSFQLSASLALKELTNGLCLVNCAVIVSAIVIPLAQYRGFEEMTWIVYIGAIAIIFPIFIIISEIAIHEHYGADTYLVMDTGFNASVVACMDVLFAITGQVIFVEIMAEMKNPNEFPKSVYASSAVFVVVYFTMAILGYSYLGSTVLNPITENLTDMTARRWCSAFILTHIVIAYVMQVIVLARGFERIVLNQIQHEDSKHASYRDRIVWFLVTLLIVLTSFLVCNITPFINSLMGFVSAISGVTTTYVFPFLFAPVLLHEQMSRISQTLHRAFALCAIVISVIGVYASIQQMRQSYELKIPFDC